MNTETILRLGAGNPGAINAVVKLNATLDSADLAAVFLRLRHCPSIVGTKLYVLCSDLCNNDNETIVKLCRSDITNYILEDACSYQDYSGRELVKDFIK